MKTISPQEVSVLTLLAASRGNPDEIEALLSEINLADLSEEARARADEILKPADAAAVTGAAAQSSVSDLLNWAESNRRLSAKRLRK